MPTTQRKRDDVADPLHTSEDMAASLNACLEEPGVDSACIAKAIGDLARAETIGVGAEILSRHGRGVTFPSHVTLVRLAKALGSSTDALLGVAHSPYADASGGAHARCGAAQSDPTGRRGVDHSRAGVAGPSRAEPRMALTRRTRAGSRITAHGARCQAGGDVAPAQECGDATCRDGRGPDGPARWLRGVVGVAGRARDGAARHGM